MEKTNAADAELHTKILGFKIENPAEGEFVKAFQPVAEETEEGEDIPITVLASEQCSTALQIAQYLEDVGIIGGAKSIDTTDLGDIQLWYGEQYKVLFGDASELPLKIKSMNGVIKERGSNGSGVMDVSFTVLPNEVICTPFS